MIDATLYRFLLVGVGNTILGIGVIFAARQFVDDFSANLIGYLVVVPVSFLTHRGLSFQDEGKAWPAFFRYLPSIGVGYLTNLGVLHTGLSIGANPYATQTVAILTHVLITYLLSRYVVFQSQRG